MLAYDKRGLLHCPLPFHVGLLKVAGPRCPYILVTAARFLMFSNFYRRGQWHMIAGDRRGVPGSSDPVSTAGNRRGDESHCGVGADCERTISIVSRSTSTLISIVCCSWVLGIRGVPSVGLVKVEVDD